MLKTGADIGSERCFAFMQVISLRNYLKSLGHLKVSAMYDMGSLEDLYNTIVGNLQGFLNDAWAELQLPTGF